MHLVPLLPLMASKKAGIVIIAVEALPSIVLEDACHVIIALWPVLVQSKAITLEDGSVLFVITMIITRWTVSVLCVLKQGMSQGISTPCMARMQVEVTAVRICTRVTITIIRAIMQENFEQPSTVIIPGVHYKPLRPFIVLYNAKVTKLNLAELRY